MLLTVTPRGELVVPTGCEGKVNAEGETLAPGAGGVVFGRI
jgi:hypothetical protein